MEDPNIRIEELIVEIKEQAERLHSTMQTLQNNHRNLRAENTMSAFRYLKQAIGELDDFLGE